MYLTSFQSKNCNVLILYNHYNLELPLKIRQISLPGASLLERGSLQSEKQCFGLFSHLICLHLLPLTCFQFCFSSVQFSSVTQLCPTLCDPMNCSMPGLPVHHQLPEFTQTHVHRVSDAIQPSHPLSSPSPPAPNPSQHQSLFQ